MRLLILAFLVATIFACKNQAEQTTTTANKPHPNYDPAIAGSFSTQTSKFLDSTLVDTFFQQYPSFKPYEESVRKFYAGRKYAYAWYDNDGLIEQANHLYNRMTSLTKEGLPDSTLYQKELTDLMQHSTDPKSASMLDLMLTGQYFHYSQQNFFSNVSEADAKKINWFIPRNKFDVVKVLDDAVSSGKDIFDNEPVYRQYGLLKQQIIEMHKKGIDTIQTKIVIPKKAFKSGDSSLVINQIRNRLALLGDIQSSNNSYRLDDQLAEGIMAFQKRHGLEENGKISNDFISELNVSGKDRVRQMLVNLERYRWVPSNVKGKNLVVNIPEYMLHAYEGDTLLWDMKVIVGKESLNTVVFNGDIQYLVFSPYWNIPNGILERKILPAMQRNSNYLKQNNMEIVGYNGSTPIIRQKPGADNSLGKVKFMFPNSYSIYLHDTPEKNLFEEANRSFSSGCVRVQDPLELAKYLMKDMPDWTEEKILQAMNANVEKRVNLKTKMPVYIGYFTSWVDRSGKLNFRKDIYKRDEKLAQMLINN